MNPILLWFARRAFLADGGKDLVAFEGQLFNFDGPASIQELRDAIKATTPSVQHALATETFEYSGRRRINFFISL